MAGLKTLNARGLPEAFDLLQHGEKPIIRRSFKDNTLRLSYIFPGYRLSHAPGKKKEHMGPRDAYHNEIGIAGAGFLSESGKPLLPSFGRFVQIPPGHHYVMQIKKGAYRQRKNIRIKPAQENVTDQHDWVFEFDDDAYREDKFYPSTKDIVDVQGPLYMDGYRVLCIHVRPFQFNPVKELLRCYSNIEVSITFRKNIATDQEEPVNGEVPLWVYQDGTPNLEGFGNFIFNPERKYFDQKGLLMPKLDTPASRPPIPELIVIYGESFKEPARKLQAWKQKLGLDTAVVPISDIFDPINCDKAERIRKIKNYIRTHRRVPLSPLRYVLLFGDIGSIPTEERKQAGDADPPLFDTTDFYYFTHRDARQDECLLPWVAGGRIPVLTEAEGLSVVNQIVRYERNPPNNPEYYNRMTVAAYFEDCDRRGIQDGRAEKAYLKTMEAIRNHMLSHGLEVHRVYVTNNSEPTSYADGTPVPLEVRDALIDKANGHIATKKLIDLINAGQLIMGHRGHGDQGGWQDPPLSTDDLTRVSSHNPSVFFSINCRTGSFDGNRECFAEKILALDGGAPSLIASTELSGAWRNDSMIKALFDAIWPGIISTYPVTTMRFPVKYYRMGDIMNYAKAYLMTAHGVNAKTQTHFEIYHVLGDPTLQIWGSEPLPLQLRARIKTDILVINMNTCPQNAVLSIWYAGNSLLTLKPTGTRLAIPLRLLKTLPKDAQDPKRDKTYQLSIYFSAPGHRLAVSDLWF